MNQIPNDSRELDLAYRRTDFWVYSPTGWFAIRIGHTSRELEELLSRKGARSWAYITACNPKSQELPAEQNAGRMSEFRELLNEAGHHFFEGEGIGLTGTWPPEASFLILDIDEGSARALARRYDQHAFVCGDIGESARLMWSESIG